MSTGEGKHTLSDQAYHWLRRYITAEVGKEDHLIRIFNIKRKALELEIRVQTESQDVHDANVTQAAKYHERAEHMLAEMADVYTKEFEAITSNPGSSSAVMSFENRPAHREG